MKKINLFICVFLLVSCTKENIRIKKDFSYTNTVCHINEEFDYFLGRGYDFSYYYEFQLKNNIEPILEIKSYDFAGSAIEPILKGTYLYLKCDRKFENPIHIGKINIIDKSVNVEYNFVYNSYVNYNSDLRSLNEYLGINQLFAANQYFPRISYHDNMVHLRICSELCKNKYENITLNNMYCNDDDVEFYNGRYIYTADDIGDTPLSSKYESKCVSITSPLSLSFKGDESLWIFYNHRVKNDAFEEGWYERQVILDVDIDGHQYFLADTFSFQVS